jgi:hypothetical protein
VKLSTLALLGALVPSIALADSAIVITDYSTTLGTSATQCVPANSQRKTLYIENAGTTNSISYCVAPANGTCTPATNTAGSSTLAPATSTGQGNTAWWNNGSAPTGPLYCIASGSSSPVTIRSGQ